MAIDYDKYIAYQVRSATMNDEVAGRRAQIQAENLEKQMEANISVSMYNVQRAKDAETLLQSSGYDDATITATKQHLAKNALKELGVTIIDGKTKQPIE